MDRLAGLVCYTVTNMKEARSLAPAFSTAVRVRYADTDCEGVVYYGSYLTYFEVARVELLRALGVPIGEVRRRGLVMPAIDARCCYHRPGRVDDLLEVRVWLGERHRATFGFDYEIWRADELVASGNTRHLCVEVEGWRAVRPPAWFDELWERAAAGHAISDSSIS